MTRKHLSRKYVLQDELYLEKIVDSQEKCKSYIRLLRHQVVTTFVHWPMHIPVVKLFLSSVLMAARKTPASPLSKGKKSLTGSRDKPIKRGKHDQPL